MLPPRRTSSERSSIGSCGAGGRSRREWSRATRRRSSPNHHLVDPSLAAAAVGASADALFNERTALGLLFESMALRDLRVYAQANRSTIFHYRDKAKLEVDAVVERDDGRWIAAEVKLGVPHAIEEAAQALLALRAKVDTSVTGPPRARRRHLHGTALHESRRRRRNAAHRNAAVAIQPADCRVRASGRRRSGAGDSPEPYLRIADTDTVAFHQSCAACGASSNRDGVTTGGS